MKFKDARINYALGVLMSVLMLGFFGAPFLGRRSGFGMLKFLDAAKGLGDDLTLALCVFEILGIIFVCALLVLGVVGFCLVKFKRSTAEYYISWVYSVVVLLAAIFVLVFLCLALDFGLESGKLQYGYYLLWVLVILLPIFAKQRWVLVSFLFWLFRLPLVIGLGLFEKHCRNEAMRNYEKNKEKDLKK